MSAANRSSHGLEIQIPNGQTQGLPLIEALFVVQFDMRRGYTIAWQRSTRSVILDGVVDFKSLPSGLHNVNEDLVYFTHGDHVGISAFVNRPATESERHARMLAVGTLLPCSYGRLGRSWLYADALMDLARQQVMVSNQFEALEDLWNKHKVPEIESSHSSSGSSSRRLPTERSSRQHNKVLGRDRAMSDGHTFTPHETFPSHHPVMSMLDFTDLFGPLVFLLYRAALLHKRILMIGEAPVEFNCNMVYDLSIISSVPRSILSLLPVDGIPPLRLRPLYNVGVHDISTLSASTKTQEALVQSDSSWIACTTDDVLGTKPHLFDLLVTIPANHTTHATKKVYPKIVPSSPSLSQSFPKLGLKATQRDARRYRTLRSGLQSFPTSRSIPRESESIGEDDESFVSAASTTFSHESVVEPTSWPLQAYSSLIWWASAGDRRSDFAEEEEAQSEQDHNMLMADPETSRGMVSDQPQQTSKEVAIVAYFHRLTNLIFTTISDAITREDGEDVRRDYEQQVDLDDQVAMSPGENEDAVAETEGSDDNQPLLEDTGQEAGPVTIGQEDMTLMGLDIWSINDRTFVEELVALWWGRRAVVHGGRLQCCGVRII